MLEEPNIKINGCLKGDIDFRFASVNIAFHTQINLDIGLPNTNICISLLFMQNACYLIGREHITCDPVNIDIGLEH